MSGSTPGQLIVTAAAFAYGYASEDWVTAFRYAAAAPVVGAAAFPVRLGEEPDFCDQAVELRMAR